MIADVLSEHIKFSVAHRSIVRTLIRKHPGYRAWCRKRGYKTGKLLKVQLIEGCLEFGLKAELEAALLGWL